MQNDKEIKYLVYLTVFLLSVQGAFLGYLCQEVHSIRAAVSGPCQPWLSDEDAQEAHEQLQEANRGLAEALREFDANAAAALKALAEPAVGNAH